MRKFFKQAWGEYLYFEKLKKQGVKIEILLLNPDSPATDSAAKCQNQSNEDFCEEVKRSVAENNQDIWRNFSWVKSHRI